MVQYPANEIGSWTSLRCVGEDVNHRPELGEGGVTTAAEEEGPFRTPDGQLTIRDESRSVGGGAVSKLAKLWFEGGHLAVLDGLVA